MNKKGQALIEFVLVLPILIFMILAIIDISKITIAKNHLESILSSVNKDTTNIKDKEYKIILTKKDVDNETLVELKTCLDVITPGLNRILGNPTCVTTSKYVE